LLKINSTLKKIGSEMVAIEIVSKGVAKASKRISETSSPS
jgi:hypothetical protein